ncbi:calcium-binding protein [Ralstonia pseudosolanacearum]
MSTVELFNDTSGAIPHTFIVVTDDSGVPHGYGFYPATGGSSNDNGVLKDNTNHPFTSRSGAQNLTPEQYSNLMSYIHQTETNPPPYALTFGSMCTTWAIDALKHANGGGDPRLPNFAPNSFWEDIKESILWNPWTMEVKVQVNNNWRSANTYRPHDPLAIDLDGDGIKSVAINTFSPILFDHNGDGIKTATGWLQGSDAWLVRDINGNGTIDSGLELFGVDTDITVNGVTRKAENGFESLATLDSNGDKVFDEKDAAFSQVRLWQDLNQNGISEANELSTLSSKGITSIALNYTSTNTDLGGGNSITGKAVVTRSKGTSEVDSVSVGGDSTANNLNLADNPFYRSFTPIAHSGRANSLPDMHGSGAVRDLRDAMSLGSAQANTLAATVQQFAQATTRDADLALVDQLIQQWGNTSSLVTSSPFASGATIYTTLANPNAPQAQSIQTFAQQNPTLFRKIIALEQFNGATGLAQLITRWGANLPAPVVASLENSYAALRESVYDSLVTQTRLKPYFDSIKLSVNDQGVTFDSSNLVAALEKKKVSDPKGALIDLIELHKYASSTLSGIGLNETQKLSEWLSGIDATSSINDVDWTSLNTFSIGNDVVLGNRASDTLKVGDGNDFVWAGFGDDQLDGGAGDDTLDGGGGNDTITDTSGTNTLKGGAGNDTITGRGTFQGGTGNDSLVSSDFYSGDTYLFNVGDGQDTISDYGGSAAIGYTTAGDDTLKFGAGIDPGAVTLARSGNDLVFKVNATDQVTVKDWYVSSRQYIEKVQFSDSVNTAWDITKLKGMTSAAYSGTVNAETINGWDGIDNIAGLGGNDTINAYAGNDVLDGGDGNDSILAGDGNDQVLGGLGLDTIDGGNGDDTIDGGDDNDTITDTVGTNTLRGGAGNDTITGRGTFQGGTGNDSLVSSDFYSGDTYLFNVGDGQDTISDYGGSAAMGYTTAGDDTLKFGAGIDPGAVTLARSGNDLVFKVNATDQVTVKDWYVSSRQYIEKVQFSDSVNTAWDITKLKGMTSAAYSGTVNAETINGWDGIDNIAGLGGNDTINAYAGNDVLDGGDGNDSILAGDGNDQVFGGLGLDTIDGGNGDDVIDGGGDNDTITDTSGTNTLKGGAGNDTIIGRGTFQGGTGNDSLVSSDFYSGDTYLFNVGDGQDTISDYGGSAAMGYTTAGDDTLKFGAGINSDQLWFQKIGNDLSVSRIGTSDGVVVKNWYTSGSQHIEQFQSGDGKALKDTQVDALVQAMAGFALPTAGQTTLPASYQSTLSPVIAANWK